MGVKARWSNYDRAETSNTIPRYVKRALDNDYKITHKALLVWAPLPGPADVPRLRMLFVAVEAALSFVFWAMVSKDSDYGMGDCCPWPRDLFSYGGLCGHNPLHEGLIGNLDLTAEQLEDVAARAKETERANKAQWHQTQKELDPQGFAARMKLRVDRHRENNRPQIRERDLILKKKTWASKKYYCEPCDVSCTSDFALKQHTAMKTHLKVLEDIALAPVTSH